MKKNLTEIVFILDRSGSMGGLESDTIGGYNSMLKKQQDEEGEAVITTVLFDDKMEVLHNRLDIKGIKPMTNKQYYVRGCTALLDAVGKSINNVANAHRLLEDNQVPEKVLFVITTDGLENASEEFTYTNIKRLIEVQKSKAGWEFIFLGANIDAAEEAGRMGISPENAVNYNNDSLGTSLNYEVMSDAISEYRTKRAISKNWKARVDDDFNKRGK